MEIRFCNCPKCGREFNVEWRGEKLLIRCSCSFDFWLIEDTEPKVVWWVFGKGDVYSPWYRIEDTSGNEVKTWEAQKYG